MQMDLGVLEGQTSRGLFSNSIFDPSVIGARPHTAGPGAWAHQSPGTRPWPARPPGSHKRGITGQISPGCCDQQSQQSQDFRNHELIPGISCPLPAPSPRHTSLPPPAPRLVAVLQPRLVGGDGGALAGLAGRQVGHGAPGGAGGGTSPGYWPLVILRVVYSTLTPPPPDRQRNRARFIIRLEE